MVCVYMCEYDKDTHTHTGFMRLCCWLFTGSAPLYLLSITADCWPCSALLGQNHLLCCQGVSVCTCVRCSHPPCSYKTHLPINPRLFNASPYLLSLGACVACFTTHLWGVKHKRHGAVLPQRLRGKECIKKQKIAGRPNTFHLSRCCFEQCGSANRSPHLILSQYPLSFLSETPNQTSYQPIKQANPPHITHLITLSKINVFSGAGGMMEGVESGWGEGG